MTCPSCDAPIAAVRILLKANPIWIRCPACRAKLKADATIRWIGFVAFLLAVAATVPLVFWIHAAVPGWGMRAVWFGLCAVAVSAAIGIPFTALAMRRGRYLPREPSLR